MSKNEPNETANDDALRQVVREYARTKNEFEEVMATRVHPLKAKMRLLLKRMAVVEGEG